MSLSGGNKQQNDLNNVDENGVLVLKHLARPTRSVIDQTKQGLPCEVEKVLVVDLDNVIEAELKPQELSNKEKVPQFSKESDSSTQSYTLTLMCNSCNFDTTLAEVLEKHNRSVHGHVGTDSSTTNGEESVNTDAAKVFKPSEKSQKIAKFSLRRKFRKRTQNQGESAQSFMEDLQRLARSCGFCADREVLQ